MAIRTKSRELAVQASYQHAVGNMSLDALLTFSWEEKDEYPAEVFLYAADLVHGLFEHHNEIDALIQSYIDKLKVYRVQEIDRAVLRVAVFGLLYEPEIPMTIVINEALNIAKRFGEEGCHKYINRILEDIVIEEIPTERKTLS